MHVVCLIDTDLFVVFVVTLGVIWAGFVWRYQHWLAILCDHPSNEAERKMILVIYLSILKYFELLIIGSFFWKLLKLQWRLTSFLFCLRQYPWNLWRKGYGQFSAVWSGIENMKLKIMKEFSHMGYYGSQFNKQFK